MQGNILEIIKDKYFTKHKIINSKIEHHRFKGYESGKFIWCKLDKESNLSKRNISGMKIYNIWAATANFKHIIMLTPNEVQDSLSNPIIEESKQIKPSAEDLNKLITLIKTESSRLTVLRKFQAVTLQNSEQSKSKTGYVTYTFDHRSLKITHKKEKINSLDEGDLYKIKHLSEDKNELILRKNPNEVYIIDDLKLCMLICRSNLKK